MRLRCFCPACGRTLKVPLGTVVYFHRCVVTGQSWTPPLRSRRERMDEHRNRLWGAFNAELGEALLRGSAGVVSSAPAEKTKCRACRFRFLPSVPDQELCPDCLAEGAA